jgi:hypothetical protein
MSASASVDEAEAAVEAIDVRNDEFRFYDANGLVLRAVVRTDTPPLGRLRRLLAPAPERIEFMVPEVEDRRPEELTEILRGFLSRAGSMRAGIPDAELAAAPLPKLIDATVKLAG